MTCENNACSITEQEIESAITRERQKIKEKYGDFFSGENLNAYLAHRKAQLPELLRNKKTLINGIEEAVKNMGSPEARKTSLMMLLDKVLDNAEMYESGKIPTSAFQMALYTSEKLPVLSRFLQWKTRTLHKKGLRAGAIGMLTMAKGYIQDASQYGFLELPEFKGLKDRYNGLVEKVGGLQA